LKLKDVIPKIILSSKTLRNVATATIILFEIEDNNLP